MVINTVAGLTSFTFLFWLTIFCCAVNAATTTEHAISTRPSPQSHTELLSEDQEITLSVFPAEGRYLLLWIAPSYGFHKGHTDIAWRLADRGMEVWQADIADALFLPRNSMSMRSLTGVYVADLIERAHQKTGKKVVLVSGSYGAIPVLRGARLWQLRKPAEPYFIGAILFSPSLYTSVPPLGKDPDYVPITKATNIPIMVFQGAKHGNRWQLQPLVAALQNSGSQVYAEIMDNVAGLFFDQPLSPEAQALFNNLPNKIKNTLRLLDNTPMPLVALDLTDPEQVADKGIDISLKPFQGDPKPHPIKLYDANAKQFNIENYQGKTTLVNFWASWCKPCVKEIPSLNRLRQHMADKNFRLISINYAEEPAVIKEFMENVKVEFPVLIDRNGKESAKWKVIAFPSTFVIGPDGKIHYGVNAAIHWDSDSVINTLEELSN
jgi:thiol-disulfide isomerase/thioredoxin